MADEPQSTPPVDTTQDPPAEPDPKDDTGTPEEWTPPTQEEFEALQKSVADISDRLKKANNESAKRRQAIKDLEKQNESDADRAVREAEEKAAAKWKPQAIRALAKSGLAEAGARADRVGALSRMLDLNSVDLDGDEVTGLTEQIDTLKNDFPELFAAKEPVTPKATPPAAPKVPRGAKTPAEEPKSIGEQIAAQFFGNE